MSCRFLPVFKSCAVLEVAPVPKENEGKSLSEQGALYPLMLGAKQGEVSPRTHQTEFGALAPCARPLVSTRWELGFVSTFQPQLEDSHYS